MELKDFISKTISDVASGIEKGNGYIVENNIGKGLMSSMKYVNFDIYVYPSEKSNDDSIFVSNSAGTQSQNHLTFGVEFHVNGFKE